MILNKSVPPVSSRGAPEEMWRPHLAAVTAMSASATPSWKMRRDFSIGSERVQVQGGPYLTQTGRARTAFEDQAVVFA